MDFLEETLLRCQGEVWLSSLSNDREDSRERHVLTRDPERLRSWAAKQDVAGRGTFLCVSTVKAHSRRNLRNVVETPFAHSDIDLKDVDLTADQVEGVLDELARPPSYVVRSGNGVHAYWALDPPAAAGDAMGPLLKKLARMVAGDRTVTHSAALMRLPGSHNSKRGAWKEVVVTRATGRTYSLEELEAWDCPVVILARGKAAMNPYEQVAHEQSYEAPVDVDERLAQMVHHGDDQTAIHNTKLSVTAALLSRGEEVEDVVEKVLEAVLAVPGTERWDRTKEEKLIRGMCADWLRKYGTVTKTVAKSVPGGATVASLAEARAAKEAKEEPKPKKPEKAKAHVVLGMGVLAELRSRGSDLAFVGGHLYVYEDYQWRMLMPAVQESWLNVHVERACQALKVVSKNTLVNEVRNWIKRQPELFRDDVEWDAHGLIATRSGLLDPKTRELRPHRPEDWTTKVLPCEYDPRAKCKWWLKMLGDALGEGEVKLLQEVVGSFLVVEKPLAMRRALVLLGASHTGKSSLINVVQKFFGGDANSATLESLEGTHGMMPFLQSVPWVLHEAFEQGKWHFSSNVKAILSADTIHVNVKNGPMVSRTFKQPVMWGTNVSPQFRESTKAMQNRLIVIKCETEFGAEPVGAALEAQRQGHDSLSGFILAKERSGILCWALEGLDRLRARGHFELPEDVRDTMHEVWLGSNVAAGFMEECAEVDEGWAVANPDFYGAFMAWWNENHGDQRAPSSNAIGMALKNLGDRRIRVGMKVGRMRCVVGVKLNETGLSLWQAFSTSRMAQESSQRLSDRPEAVNQRVSRAP